MLVKELNRDNFNSLLKRPGLETSDLISGVKLIIDSVLSEGDDALLELTARFDGVKLTADRLRVSPEEIGGAREKVENSFAVALKTAISRIKTYHEKQSVKPWLFENDGATLGQNVTALKRVGVYVPGGSANYPSSVLMNVIPAQVAGVDEIALCCPPDQSGSISPYVLTAAGLLGINEIYRLGGAQAIAALAYGTESIKKVDKITGPGNVYVTLAKKLVVGDVGIDMLAGPSEVMIVADERANPEFIAADMLAQAEHDSMATAILVTTDQTVARLTAEAIEDQLEHLERKDIAVKSLQTNGKILVASDLALAVDFINEFAPEHLEIMTSEPEKLLPKVRNAGAIFLGDYTPEALGDYIAGSNHILPTGGTARFYSPLGVADFVKRSSTLSFTKEAAEKLSAAGETIASVEGLGAHARSLSIRKEAD